VLLYHIVSSAKYRRVVFTKEVDKVLVETCNEIELRYEVHFLEIGADADHVHFLVQSVPTYSVTEIVRTIKSLIAREVFKHCPEVKRQLWGGEFWGKGYFVNTVGQHGTEAKIAEYVRNQGVERQYKKLMSDHQLRMFD
jgi:putative transposase